MGFLHFTGRCAAIPMQTDPVSDLRGRFILRWKDEEVGSNHLYIPIQDAPSEWRSFVPIEELEKGIVLRDAVAHIQSAISFQSPGFFLTFIEFIDRCIHFGDYVWFQGIFDYEISIGIHELQLFGGQGGVTVQVILNRHFSLQFLNLQGVFINSY